ncbi:MAG: YncE family protein [Bacteroidia bacterium]
MKTILNAMFLMCLMALTSCSDEMVLDNTAADPADKKTMKERVVVANRASGDISVIDATTNTVIGTYAMPDGGEPMYAVHIPQAKAVFVGDRANDRVVAFDEDDYSVKGTVDAGSGVFHMWASPNGSQLWVNNDIDNTTTIINPASMRVKGTTQTPADLVDLGGKPHDVFVDPDKKHAYVSVLGVNGSNDYIVKYNTNQYQEVDRVAVGKDPHLFADNVNNLLYVPCQGSNSIYVIDRSSMSVVQTLPFNGAHGIFMPGSGQYIYVGDIGASRIGTFETSSHTQVGTPANAPFPTAHNLTVNAAEDKLFVTHSGGMADQVTIWALNHTASFTTSVTVGTNPFGLVYYRYR